MWMVSPNLMCTKHLIAEHNEIHMFIGNLKKGRQVSGYCKNNQLEVKSLYDRHQDILNEMCERGYNHNTPLEKCDIMIEHLPEEVKNYTINKEISSNILRERCSSCNENMTLFEDWMKKSNGNITI